MTDPLGVQPLKEPFGPGVPQPPLNLLVHPVDPFANYAGLQAVRAMPQSDDWIRDQFDPHRLGSFAGGADLQQLSNYLNPGNYTVNGPRPDLLSPLTLSFKNPRQDHFGNFQFDFLDLTGSYEGVMRAFGLVSDGQATPGGDLGAELAKRDIDPFGMGATGAPARLADYAISWPMLLARRALGDTSYQQPGGPPQQAKPSQAFNFETETRYWTYLTYLKPEAADQSLKDLAHGIAVDNLGTAYDSSSLELTLYTQMQKDRQIAQGFTSGDDRTDYQAKLMLQTYLAAQQPAPIPVPAQSQGFLEDLLIGLGKYGPTDPMGGGSGFPLQVAPNPLSAGSTEASQMQLADLITQVPFVGTDVAQAAVPVSDATELAWQNLSFDERQQLLGGASTVQGLNDVAEMLIGFGGVGMLRGLAAAGKLTEIGVQAARVYDMTLKATNIIMAAGLVSAAANYALEVSNILPGYKQDVGDYVDASRPLSSSYAAGMFNALGYLGSGTYGAAQAAKTIRWGVGKVLDLGASRLGALGRLIPRPLFGPKEFQYFRTVYGGSRTINFLDRLTGGAIGDRALRPAIQGNMLSNITNSMRDELLAAKTAEWEGATLPGSTHPMAELYKSDGAAFFRARDADLANLAEATPHVQQAVLSYLASGHMDLSPFALGATEEAHAAARRMAKMLDDMATQYHVSRYGTQWEHIIEPAQAQNELRQMLSSLGATKIDEKMLAGFGKGPLGMDRAKQVLEATYAANYYHKFANLVELAKATKESGDVALGSLRNVYRDEVQEIVPFLRGKEADALLEVRGTQMTREEVMKWVLDRDNIWGQGMHAATPLGLAAKLDKIKDMLSLRRVVPEGAPDEPLNAFQRQMENEGRWTVVHKPVRLEGAEPTMAGPIEQSITGAERAQSDFASIRTLDDGSLYKAPWVESPLGSLDQIELGNRGYLASLWDSASMGTRAWRIGEFQRANLHRLIQTRFVGVTEHQINSLHKAIETMARNPTSVTFFRIGGKLRKAEGGLSVGHMSSLQGWAHTPQAADAVKTVFPDSMISRATGEKVAVDWNDLLAQAYRQSYRLNALAGLTSQLKGMPLIGKSLTYVSEELYLMWRFGLSPLFKASEWVESGMFNLGRGVYWEDPMVRDMILRSTGRNDADIIGSEWLIGDQQLQGIGSYRATMRTGSASQATYGLTGQESALATSRQTRPPSLAQAQAPGDLAKPVFGPEVTRGLSTDYPQSIPDALLPRADDGAVSHAGGTEISDLLIRQQHDLFDGMPPEQRIQVARVNGYLPGLANEWAPLAEQPLRIHAQDAPGRFSAPVVLKADAYDSTVIPHYGDIAQSSGAPMPVLDEGTRAEIIAAWGADIQNARIRLPSAQAKQWADEYLAYRLGDIPAPPAEPRLLNKNAEKQWAAQRQAIVDHISNDLHADVPPEGGALASQPTMSGTPLTPAAIAQVRLLEFQHAIATANPEQTLAEILGNRMTVSNAKFTTTRIDHDWQHVDAVFLKSGDTKAWDRFAGRFDEAHPISNAEVRFYDGTDAGLQQAYTLYMMERGGIADMASRKLSSLGLLDQDSELLARKLHDAVNQEPFVNAVREAAAKKLGYDPGVPMVRAYLRGGRAQGDELVVTVQASNGVSLQLSSQDLEGLWQSTGLPTTFAGLVGDRDAVTYLRNQGRHAMAWEPTEGTAGKFHVYTDPDAAAITGSFDGQTWSDAKDRGIPMFFADRFHGSASYTPVSDLYPRFEVGKTLNDQRRGVVTYDSGKWHYDYTAEGSLIDVRLDPSAHAGFQREEQLRDIFARWPDKTVRVELPDGESADALGRLWLRGELPTNAAPVFEGKLFDLAAMRTRMGVPEDVANAVTRPVGDFRDLPHTSDAIGAESERQIREAPPLHPRDQDPRIIKMLRKLGNPVPWKLGEQAKLEAFIVRNSWADILERGNPQAYALYTKTLRVPRAQLTAFKVEDRYLYERWVQTQSREDLDALVGHASKYTKDTASADEVRAFYESETWSTVHDLWLLNAKMAQQEAFTTHFFSSYRSALERSLNHPVLGIFPLSWSYKAGREWAMFLFNNRMLGLRIGMTPAVALKAIQRGQDQWWAQQGYSEESFGAFISSRKGAKFSSLMYMANLLLPGDWSGIPFPLAWPIRTALRWVAGDPHSPITNIMDPGYYLDNWGISRDARLFREGAGEIMTALQGPQPAEPTSTSVHSLNSRALYDDQQVQAAPQPRPAASPSLPPGLLEAGNIDLNNRPVVHNADGSISTVRSITIEEDGKYILIPTVVGDKVVSDDDAIAHYDQTGEQLGIFSSEDAADQYAQQLHEDQAAQYVP